jgi:hypothetical protein
MVGFDKTKKQNIQHRRITLPFNKRFIKLYHLINVKETGGATRVDNPEIQTTLSTRDRTKTNNKIYLKKTEN